jgi:hypothetical protein
MRLRITAYTYTLPKTNLFVFLQSTVDLVQSVQISFLQENPLEVSALHTNRSLTIISHMASYCSDNGFPLKLIFLVQPIFFICRG